MVGLSSQRKRVFGNLKEVFLIKNRLNKNKLISNRFLKMIIQINSSRLLYNYPSFYQIQNLI
jgi:hypothetical protein